MVLGCGLDSVAQVGSRKGHVNTVKKLWVT